MTGREEVVSFLKLFKACVNLGHYEVAERQKNRQGLIDLGLNVLERREVLLGLVPEDYVSGPSPDHTDPKKEVWEFGREVAGVPVYIKLRVAVPDKRHGAHHALVLSFHPAERGMKYPLRRRTP